MSQTFGPSHLGTKEFWDEAYYKELTNFKESGHTGEIWFGPQSEARIVNWLEKNRGTLLSQDSAAVLDIGCGNGSLLMELVDKGYENLTGIDYSPDAVQLARLIATREKKNIEFQVVDIFASGSLLLKGRTFSVCLDKGTYDAVCLSQQDEVERKKIEYIEFVDNLLEGSGVFIIASCNWTEEELKAQFHKRFICVESIPAPSFQFGGKTGQTVTTLVFRKKT